MKLTNIVMMNSVDVLSSLNETGKLGYACARNLRKLRDSLEEYMNVRQKLFEKYGDVVGENYVVPPEKRQAFFNELDEYATIEHDVDIFQVSEDVFCSGTLTTQQMYTLDWMVEK